MLTTTVNPGTSQSQYQLAYTSVGDIGQITLPTLATINFAWDQARREMLVTDIRGETQAFAYDNNDDPLSKTTENTSNGITQESSAIYDDLGRMTKAIGSASQTWTLAYDYLNNLASITDPLSNARSNTFDPLNRVTTQTDPESHTVSVRLRRPGRSHRHDRCAGPADDPRGRWLSATCFRK